MKPIEDREYQKAMMRYLIDAGAGNEYEAAHFHGEAIRDRIRRDGTWWTQSSIKEESEAKHYWQYCIKPKRKLAPVFEREKAFKKAQESYQQNEKIIERNARKEQAKKAEVMQQAREDAEIIYEERKKLREKNLSQPREHGGGTLAKVIETKSTGLLENFVHAKNAITPKKASYYKKKKKLAKQNDLEKE